MAVGSPLRAHVGVMFHLRTLMSTLPRLLAAGASVARRPIQTTPTMRMTVLVPHVPRHRYCSRRTICAPDAPHVLAAAAG